MEPPAWRIVHSIRSVQFILGWIWNTPYTEQLLRFAYNLICLKVANALWQCWYQVRPKQWRAVGLAELLKTSTYQREICVLTPCPRAEQIPCICDELMGHWPCLKVVCFRYVSGIVSMSLHLSSCMGVFQTCSFSMIKISIWCNIFVSDLFLGLVIQYQDLCMIITFVDMVLLEFPFTGFIEKCC